VTERNNDVYMYISSFNSMNLNRFMFEVIWLCVENMYLIQLQGVLKTFFLKY